MNEKNEVIHSYDGIQEYDNPLPGWWKWLFIISIVGSPVYAIMFHGVEGRDPEEQYSAALAANTRLQFSEIGDLTSDAATIVSYMHQPDWVRVGESVFKGNCISCHGRNGEGQIGPNLTDEAYKNVKHIEDIASIIEKGAGKGAMPAWANRLHPNEIVLVSAYVATLRGQNLPSPRPPDGQVIEAWPAKVDLSEKPKSE